MDEDEPDPNDPQWFGAIKEEIKSHIKNGTWEIVEKKKDNKLVSCKLVLKDKFRSDGTLERKKARLVARGFTQRQNIDFSETYAPVAKLSSIRFILALAAENDMLLNQMDVTTAFLNGDLEENLYMATPQDLEKNAAK
ncbi:Hypothetical protein NTJ_06823 [Nesidiocoris tenuis]|uniref:Reverse transcriptase Ty1/copia-type domain-containing protein n=1 Tax=Nesidiocoris tenuis TaxID=355587 RepID=A0ABN7AP66_9HEMI|nr:Hypothetical protein NTJ_06823 [Nesidiocoris tenuis]